MRPAVMNWQFVRLIAWLMDFFCVWVVVEVDLGQLRLNILRVVEGRLDGFIGGVALLQRILARMLCK